MSWMQVYYDKEEKKLLVASLEQKEIMFNILTQQKQQLDLITEHTNDTLHLEIFMESSNFFC